MSRPTICEAFDKLSHDLKLLVASHHLLDITVDADTFNGLGYLFASYVRSGGIEDKLVDHEAGTIKYNGIIIRRKG